MQSREAPRRSTKPPMRPNRLHGCRRVGCTARVGTRWVFCERCWDELSRPVQIALYTHYPATPTAGGRTWRQLLHAAEREHDAADQLELFALGAATHAIARRSARRREAARCHAGPSDRPAAGP